MRMRTLLLLSALLPLWMSAAGARDYDIGSYGAKPDGKTDNAVMIQKAIDDCHAAGGGRVVVPANGIFMTGPIHLKSNVELHLDAQAKLLANPDERVYTESAFGDNRGEGMLWISGRDIQHLAITGQGMIDGNGVAFMGKELSDSYELKPVTTVDPRPHLVTLINGRDIRISGVCMGNSAYWGLHFVGCEDVVVDGVSIMNDLKIRNGDGMDIDHSRNVRVSNCLIRSGDDCICLKNRREFAQYGPCHDITVTNCIMTSSSCALKIGSENMDCISNVVVSNCIIKESNRGIGIQNRDEGTVRNVLFSNMIVDCKFYSDVWWGRAEPIYITAYERKKGNSKDAGWRFPKGVSDYTVGVVSDITFSGIKCTSENGIFIGGSTADRISNIKLDRIDLSIVKRTDYTEGLYDKRPCRGEEFVKGNTYGIYIENGTGIDISDSSVKCSSEKSARYGGNLFTGNGAGVVTSNLK